MGDNLFGIGFGELAFLAILALIVFGPKRIPEVARAIRRFIRQARQTASEVEEEVRRFVASEGEPADWLEGGQAQPDMRTTPGVESSPVSPPLRGDRQPSSIAPEAVPADLPGHRPSVEEREPGAPEPPSLLG